MSKPILFNRQPDLTHATPRMVYKWRMGSLSVDVFCGSKPDEFFWTFSYDDGHGFKFGPLSDQEPQNTLELAIHAAEEAIVLLKLTLESAARHPSQPPAMTG